MTISVLLVILYRIFSGLQGCREKHTHFNKKLFSLNTLFHEGAPLPLAKNCTPLKSKMHPLNGFLSKLESFATKCGSPWYNGLPYFFIFLLKKRRDTEKSRQEGAKARPVWIFLYSENFFPQAALAPPNEKNQNVLSALTWNYTSQL